MVRKDAMLMKNKRKRMVFCLLCTDDFILRDESEEGLKGLVECIEGEI